MVSHRLQLFRLSFLQITSGWGSCSDVQFGSIRHQSYQSISQVFSITKLQSTKTFESPFDHRLQNAVILHTYLGNPFLTLHQNEIWERPGLNVLGLTLAPICSIQLGHLACIHWQRPFYWGKRKRHRLTNKDNLRLLTIRHLRFNEHTDSGCVRIVKTRNMDHQQHLAYQMDRVFLIMLSGQSSSQSGGQMASWGNRCPDPLPDGFECCIAQTGPYPVGNLGPSADTDPVGVI